jgi:ABC-type polysaccharide/polyol phosphate transport system ATPase subunit
VTAVPDAFAIEIENVSVRYLIPHERIPTLKEFAVKWLRGRLTWKQFEALSNVTFRVRPGERVGVIGRNGAGKTTLLKVIAGALRPREGRVRTCGRIAPLLELGAGFDPDLTGRENIFLYGAILGHSHRDMARRLSKIVEFAGIEEFLDAPLRTYSTGMSARLGFAIATDIHPDILLLDEVLSVGDVEFQQKCSERMNHFREQGVTFLLVSHSLATIANLCERVLWIEGGHVKADGPTAEVLEAFKANTAPEASPPTPHEPAAAPDAVRRLASS